MKQRSRFGERVRKSRLLMGLTQDELARRVGCAAITVRKIEAGDLRPSGQIAQLLARALDVPFEDQAEFVLQARSVKPGGKELDPTPTPQVKREEIGAEDLSGRAIRGYTLAERIGMGGFGVVYRATQPLVDREVAIKIVLPEYADHPDFIRRFEAEAQIVARLEHPHIVPLYDYWREPAVAYLVMRLLRGGSVEDQLQGGALPLADVADIVDQISSALRAAHRLGVVHRDLKPANILLDEDGNAYLTDFGIAKSHGNSEAKTQVGTFLGSPAYISPEQIRSDPILPQSDIYSLGVLIYELLTGQQPFKGPTPVDLAQQHLNSPVPSLRDLRDDLPPPLDAIITRATAKDPRQRYKDAVDLAADMREVTSTGRFSADRRRGDGSFSIENPYKGLRAFGEADAADFQGRDALIQQLLGRLAEDGDLSRFLAIIGPSGSGKSSVAKAGLIPALRRGGLPGSENWYIVDFTPGNRPFEELAGALDRVALGSTGDLLLELRRDPYGLVRALEQVLPDDTATELVLVIDQFEEVFTHLQQDVERRQLLDLIVATVLDERSRGRIILTLRADFVDQPLRYVDFGELLKDRSELVLPLTPDELEHAIRNPAERVGLLVEPELIAAIIGDVSDQPGALPLMQYALTEIFEQRPNGQLTLDTYRSLGGIRGALAQRADDVYAGLTPADQAAARQIFLRLVTLGEGAEDTRRRTLRSELLALSEELDQLVSRFAVYRLLTLDHDPATREPTVEVAHEALLREWPRLKEWIEHSRNDIRMQRRLGHAAQEWLGAEQDKSFLLRGMRLQQFEGWSNETELVLTKLESEFLEASLAQRTEDKVREAERAERERRMERTRQTLTRALVGVLIAGLVAALGLSAFALSQRDEALQSADARATAQAEAEIAQVAAEEEALAKAAAQTEAEAQRLEALVQASIGLASQSALELQGTSPERSVLLALEALEKYPYTWQAERALGNAVIGNHLSARFAHEAWIGSTRWSPGGSLVATGSDDGTAKIWDVATREVVFSFEHDGRVFLAEWSPSGDRLLTRSSDGQARVWDVKTGDLLLSVETDDQFGIIEWSASGDLILTHDFDGTMKIWDSRTGDELLAVSEGTSCTVVGCPFLKIWSPTGDRLLGTDGSGTIKIWDARSGNEVQHFTAPWPEIDSLIWSPDGAMVLATNDEGVAAVWNASSGNLITTLVGHSDEIDSVSWSPDGNRILTASDDFTARIWDVSTGETLLVFNEHPTFVLTGAWSPEGDRVATAGFSGLVLVWDPSTGELIQSFLGHQTSVHSVEWSPIKDQIISTSDDGVVNVWNLYGQTTLFEIPGEVQSGWEVEWSPDGRQIARGHNDGTVRVYDVETQAELLFLDGHPGWPAGDIEWSPDGSRIYTGGAWGDGSVKVWDAGSGKLLSEFVDPQGWLSYGSWSPAGSWIVSSSMINERLVIWDAASGEALATFEENVIAGTAAKWSPDGTRIALAGEGGARIFSAQTGEMTLSLFPEDYALFTEFVTWSRDGSRLAGHGDDGLMIWDADTGELLAANSGQGALVFSIDWFPAGDRIVYFDKQGFVKLFDTSTGAELLSFEMPLTGNSALSPDGKSLALAQNPNGPIEVLWIWQSTAELMDYARECCVFRELSAEEREQFGLPPADPN